MNRASYIDPRQTSPLSGIAPIPKTISAEDVGNEWNLSQIDESVEFKKVSYPAGFTSEDDLNKDGKIDNLEYQLKVHTLKDQIKGTVEEKVKLQYLQKFRKEVDFHHKAAFRFERAFRLGRKRPEKLQ